jgi:hypothetical protein
MDAIFAATAGYVNGPTLVSMMCTGPRLRCAVEPHHKALLRERMKYKLAMRECLLTICSRLVICMTADERRETGEVMYMGTRTSVQYSNHTAYPANRGNRTVWYSEFNSRVKTPPAFDYTKGCAAFAHRKTTNISNPQKIYVYCAGGGATWTGTSICEWFIDSQVLSDAYDSQRANQ